MITAVEDLGFNRLEDFAEFYHTGMFISCDSFRTMSAYYNNSNNIRLNKSIHSFIMLERDEWSKEYKIYPHVRAPKNYRTYISPQ